MLENLTKNNHIKQIVICLLIFLLSFPKLDFVFGSGCDASLPFALNYFFSHGIVFGKEVLFTYGPLGFIKMPVFIGNNVYIALFIAQVSRLIFIYLFIRLGTKNENIQAILVYGLAFLISQILNIDYIIIGIIFLCLLAHHAEAKRAHLLFAVVYATIGILIKSSIGIIAIATLLWYCIILFYQSRQLKQSVILLSAFLLSLVTCWFLIYHSLSGLTAYLWGFIQLAKDSSSAVSLYPENNWWLLSTAITGFFILPFITKDPKRLFVFILFLPAIYAVWKHGYTREENYHLKAFYEFILLFFALFCIYISTLKFRDILVLFIVISSLYINMKQTKAYTIDDKISLNGVNNFYELLFNRKEIKENAVNESNNNISAKKISTEALKLIGKSSVDVYPWDFSYIPANSLNWKTKPIIQSYAAYTEWLDKKDANYFSSITASAFIIWEYMQDLGEGKFQEIDNRYMLNDEPIAIIQLLSNYEIVYTDSQIALLKRRSSPIKFISTTSEKQFISWNKWQSIPDMPSNSIQRIKVEFPSNFIRFIKTQLYKDEAFFIELLFDNGEVKKYRFVPENARYGGLWINPYLTDFEANRARQVKSIRFNSTNPNIINGSLSISWETIKPEKTLPFLNIELQTLSEKPVFESKNDFEKDYQNWSTNKANITKSAYEGAKAYKMPITDEYSAGFETKISSFVSDSANYEITAYAWIKLDKKATGKLVISLDNDGNNVLWKDTDLDNFIINKYVWSQAALHIKVPANIVGTKRPLRLKSYILNTGKAAILLDNFSIRITKRK